MFVLAVFIFNIFLPLTYAQKVFNLPAPGTMVSPSEAFTPAILTGITIHPDNPLKFDFIIDTGDDDLQGEELHQESEKLIKYFMTALTVPEKELWVNLSPYEKDRIIANGLGGTQMGIDMLAQDYILKQLAASLMYPENKTGNEILERVYRKAKEKYGTIEIPMDAFNKIWIVPERASVYVDGNSVFIADSYLKVLLEEDYLAMQNNQLQVTGEESLSEVQRNVIREVVIPEIEREVNEGKNFASLRQVFYSMILATWYKEVLKESELGRAYIDKNKIKGIDIEDKGAKYQVYDQYLKAFQVGVYDFIKEEYDAATQTVIPKRYFSGGEDFAMISDKIYEINGKRGFRFWRKGGNYAVAKTGVNPVGLHGPESPVSDENQKIVFFIKELETRLGKSLHIDKQDLLEAIKTGDIERYKSVLRKYAQAQGISIVEDDGSFLSFKTMLKARIKNLFSIRIWKASISYGAINSVFLLTLSYPPGELGENRKDDLKKIYLSRSPLFPNAFVLFGLASQVFEFSGFAGDFGGPALLGGFGLWISSMTGYFFFPDGHEWTHVFQDLVVEEFFRDAKFKEILNDDQLVVSMDFENTVKNVKRAVPTAKQFRSVLESLVNFIDHAREADSLKNTSVRTEASKTLPEKPGGIDLNPEMMDLQMQGGRIKYDIPFGDQSLESISIEGFSPVIYQIVPVNLQILMGTAKIEAQQQVTLAQ